VNRGHQALRAGATSRSRCLCRLRPPAAGDCLRPALLARRCLTHFQEPGQIGVGHAPALADVNGAPLSAVPSLKRIVESLDPGLPVFGDRSRIHDAIQALTADEILIALPTASGEAVRGIIRWCEKERVRFRVVPGIWEIIRGDVRLQQIRPVRAEDLLGRETVELDVDLVRGAYQGKRLLVTGAGGSIGSEICRQLLLAGPAELILLGRGENSIFEADLSFRDHPAPVPTGLLRSP